MMDDDLLLIIAGDDEAAPLAWMRVSDGRIIARGRDLDMDVTETVVVFVPACWTTLRWLDLPELAPAQADAAARLALSDVILSSHPVHLATQQGSGRTVAAWLDEDRMRKLLARLSGRGLTPDAVIPVALAVPAPAEGTVRFTINGETILRTGDAVWVDDAALTPVLLGAQTEVMLDDRMVEAALVEAARNPPLDLLTGPFTPRRGWGVDGAVRRTLFALSAVLALVTIAIPAVEAVRLNSAATRLEAAGQEQARALFPDEADPMARLQRDLVSRVGGGAGFLPSVAAINAGVASVPGAELSKLSFGSNGVVETTARVKDAAALSAIRARIESQGFVVEAGPPTSNQGLLLVPLKVRG